MEAKKSNSKAIVVALVALAVLLAGAIGLYQHFKPEASAGAKNITINATFAGGETKSYEIKTDGEFLVDALRAKDLIPEADVIAGYISTFDGVTVNSANNEWWQIFLNGEMTDYGINTQAIADGEVYEIKLSTY